jgi:cobalamin biosynthesis Mg chelatase CobN
LPNDNLNLAKPMTSNPYPKPSVSKLTTPGQSTPATTNAYAPAVPISVYRQLAAELQATRVMLESLNAHNQQLVQQNQLLRRELDKIVQSAVYLKQIVDSSPDGWSEAGYTHPEIINQQGYQTGAPRPMSWGPRPMSGVNASGSGVAPNAFKNLQQSVLPDKILREQAEGRYRQRSQSDSSTVNGWLYTLLIILIVITAFGAGFLVIRAFTSNR